MNAPAYRMRAAAAALTMLTVAACSSASTKQATREVSPLAGTWLRDGDTPAPKPNDPEFTRLSFEADGTLKASYVAAGGALAGVIKKAPKILEEDDSYAIVDSKTVRITEGTTPREYTYDAHDGKLYLTSASGGDAVVFSKATT